MDTTNGLQKFTETDNKINELLKLKQITPQALENLSESERGRLMEVLTENFNKLKGIERDTFYRKIEQITTDGTKNQLWESNHNQITWAVSTLMQEFGRMPTKTEIANKTELSRQTIHKHFKEYKNHALYLEQEDQFRFMADKVLAKVFTYAVQGDLKAAKLYFEVVGKYQSVKHPSIENQNNYIQINGTFISQENIKKLSSNQLIQIESIIKESQALFYSEIQNP